jgi:hypothetical protein
MIVAQQQSKRRTETDTLDALADRRVRSHAFLLQARHIELNLNVVLVLQILDHFGKRLLGEIQLGLRSEGLFDLPFRRAFFRQVDA